MSGTASTFPKIQISSSDPRERGRMMGEAAKERIVESVDVYEEIFAHYTKLSWDRVSELALEFGPPIRAYDEQIFEEIEGMAEGSSLGLGDLLALNARTEIMFGLRVPTPPECTAFFAGPTATADGHVLIGQNWDWQLRSIATTTLFEVDQGPDRPAFVMLPEAGLIGKMGFNEHGIGLALNALVSGLDVGARQVPMHVIARGILNSSTLEEAFAAIVRMRRASSATYTIASAAGEGLTVEAAPGGIENLYAIKPVDGILGHSNHFTCDVDFEDVGGAEWEDSLLRIETMRKFLEAKRGELSAETVKEVLRDREGDPYGVCSFPDPEKQPIEQGATLASLIMDLTAGTVEIAAGAPSENEYVSYAPEFAAGRTAAV